jgi:hypothetical protein
MKGVDLENKLQEVRSRLRAKDADELFETFKRAFAQNDAAEEQILQSIFGSSGEAQELDIKKLNPNHIYGLDEIKKICIDYRLRFLDAKYFKGDIPYEAITKVKALQKDQNHTIGGFKIIAPAPMFRLAEKDKDPLLFINLGNGLYYLVHKWGGEISAWRKAIMYPFRSFESLFTCIVVLAFSISMAVPSDVMMGPKDTTSMHIRVIFFFYLFLAFSGLTALYGFSRMKNFSVALWKSKYFD